MTSWAQRVEQRCAEVERQGRWRQPLSFDAAGPVGVLGQSGQKVVSFASNDYLGLSAHPAVVDAAVAALRRWGAGAGGSRLVTGSRPVHHELEEALADHTGCERAVLFPTGFTANLGVLSTFGDSGTLICSDELNHASIVDGSRLARADVVVFPHGDLSALQAALDGTEGPAIVVSDLVFSMDGDVAQVEGIAALCRSFGALLVLDEAHAVCGPDPVPALHDVDVLRVGTLSKTLGALGGYVAGPRAFMDLLENVARPYIFTTALTPADAAAALAALGVLHSDEGAALLSRLREHVERVRPGHPSPIIPIVLGSEQAAMDASEQLLRQGMWVPAIRPPTVAPGTARLRVTLSAAHDRSDVERLCTALADLGAGSRP